MHALGRTPTSAQIEAAVEQEHFAVLRECLAAHDRLHTPASLALLEFARRAWESAFLNERPTLRIINGGRGAG